MNVYPATGEPIQNAPPASATPSTRSASPSTRSTAARATTAPSAPSETRARTARAWEASPSAPSSRSVCPRRGTGPPRSAVGRAMVQAISVFFSASTTCSRAPASATPRARRTSAPSAETNTKCSTPASSARVTMFMLARQSTSQTVGFRVMVRLPSVLTTTAHPSHTPARVSGSVACPIKTSSQRARTSGARMDASPPPPERRSAFLASARTG